MGFPLRVIVPSPDQSKTPAEDCYDLKSSEMKKRATELIERAIWAMCTDLAGNVLFKAARLWAHRWAREASSPGDARLRAAVDDFQDMLWEITSNKSNYATWCITAIDFTMPESTDGWSYPNLDGDEFDLSRQRICLNGVVRGH